MLQSNSQSSQKVYQKISSHFKKVTMKPLMTHSRGKNPESTIKVISSFFLDCLPRFLPSTEEDRPFFPSLGPFAFLLRRFACQKMSSMPPRVQLPLTAEWINFMLKQVWEAGRSGEEVAEGVEQKRSGKGEEKNRMVVKASDKNGSLVWR